MAKPLSKILKTVEPYDKNSTSSGDKHFMDKHKVEVTPDADGNDDDVFKGGKDSNYDHNMTNHGHKKGEDESVYEAYSKSSVDKEIKKDKRIKGKEAKAIHAILKGRQKTDEPVKEETQIDEGDVIQAKFGKPPTKIASASSSASVSNLDTSEDAHKKSKFKKFAKALGMDVSDEDWAKAKSQKLREFFEGNN